MLNKLRSRSILWAGCLLLVFASTLASAQQAAIDPQALIGTWTGTWTNGAISGRYYLMLTRFENGIYYGKSQSNGSALGSVVSDLEGKLAAIVRSLGRFEMPTPVTLTP